MAAPYYFDYINTRTAEIQPSTFHVNNTGLAIFYRRYLLQKAISVFEWHIPDTWDKDYFLYTLYSYGYIAIVNTDRFGVICQQCGLKGYDIYYRPTHALIVNPLLSGMLEPRIGTQCTVIKLEPDYHGVLDLVNHYGDLMALITESLSMNLQNSHLAYVFTAGDKRAAESFKKLYDKISAGETAVVYDRSLLSDDGSKSWDVFAQNLKSNYIAPEMLNDLRTVENAFNTEIGIPSANTQKRERLITDEVNANNIETISKCALWLESCKEGCEKANKMFGLDLSVNWRYNYNSSGDVTGTGAGADTGTDT